VSDTALLAMQGLGFPQLSEMEAVPFFFNLVKAKALDEDLFTIWLSSDPLQEPAGVLTFGYADPNRYDGNITFHPVIQKAYWCASCASLLFTICA
jgi:Eukaryotic aspartyl protease